MPDNFRQETVIQALVRMQIEPYYTDYVQYRSKTIKQIKTEHSGFDINDLAYVLRTQESFLELSKYLLSDVAYSWAISDAPVGTEVQEIAYSVSSEAFDLIHYNIENKEVQKMIGNGYIEDYTPFLKPLYDWMQKNYGKYQIKRIW
jgi:hypothetical protein